MILIRPFVWPDNEWYRTWFSSPAIDKALGPAWSDSERDEVMDFSEGPVLVAEKLGAPVAVIDIALPSDGHNEVCIKGVAINPAMQGRGLGKAVIDELMHVCIPLPVDRWVAYVDRSNRSAQAFFSSLGWEQMPASPSDAMLTYALTLFPGGARQGGQPDAFGAG